MSVNTCQSLASPGSKTLRWRFESRKFMRECPCDQHLWGSEGNRTGQRKETSANPTGVLLGTRHEVGLGNSQRAIQPKVSDCSTVVGD